MIRALTAVRNSHAAVATSRMLATPQAAGRVRNSKPSIWVEFTTLAVECKAVNIGQGFPDFLPPLDPINILKNSCGPETPASHQYTRGYGHPALVSALAKLYSQTLERQINPQSEVLVTVGAYLALYYSFMGWIDKGDEVLVIEPSYDCYGPQVTMAGGVPVPVTMTLKPDAHSANEYTLDMKALYDACTPKTKMLVLNNPNNPTGKLFSLEELTQIAQFVKEKNLIVVADEVYEWHVFGGRKMHRFASLPGMFDHTITIGSAGKAFSATGWKTGWAIGPENLLHPLKMLHQNCVFTCPTPQQVAIAQAFEKELEIFDKDPSQSYLKTILPKQLEEKLKIMADGFEKAGFRTLQPKSGYFMIVDFSTIDGPHKKVPPTDPDAVDFHLARWLCREKKLAVIPTSAFYSERTQPKRSELERVCFFKDDKTIEDALKIIQNLR